VGSFDLVFRSFKSTVPPILATESDANGLYLSVLKGNYSMFSRSAFIANFLTIP